jgi:hypothetical protein
MSTIDIETDYLLVGAGATAMAFADTLLSEQTDVSITIVDRQHRPGGHWNNAYSFVRLHQPSEWYGVASRELSQGTKDDAGVNARMYGLASGAELLAYYEQVMQQSFLPSGRVRWLPMSEYSATPDGTHRVTSLTSGDSQRITVRKKVVDATHAKTAVPSTHPPRYSVAAGVTCVPVNQLPHIRRPHAMYTVVGSGKTGMDAILWLLENGLPPSRIRWVMPRDAWLINRSTVQPGIENYERSVGGIVQQFDAVAEATSIPDMFDRLEGSGQLLRISNTVEPTSYRCAVVSPGELAELRRIEDVVRLGHVRSIAPTEMLLDNGSVSADIDTLYVDCSASAIVIPPVVPVFDGGRINLLMVRTCQPVFSGALIAFVESHVSGDTEKNALCAVVPSPERPIDWLRMLAVSLSNGARWRQHASSSAWLARCRLNAVAVYMRGVGPDDTERLALAQAMGAKSRAAAAKASALMAAPV